MDQNVCPNGLGRNLVSIVVPELACRQNSQWVLIHVCIRTNHFRVRMCSRKYISVILRARVRTNHFCVQIGRVLRHQWAHFSSFIRFFSHTIFLFSLLGFWDKTLDPSILKLPNSNPTSETWSSMQDLCFYLLVWGKSENPSSSRFCVIFGSLSLIFQFSLGIVCFRVFLINSKHWVLFLVRNQCKISKP
jgi:hypothetical protein